MQKVTEQQLQINIYNPRTFFAFFYEFGFVCVGTPLPLHNKYIYKTTKDSLKLMIMGVLGGCIESHLVYQLDPGNATPGNLASDMTTQFIIIFFMKDLISECCYICLCVTKCNAAEQWNGFPLAGGEAFLVLRVCICTVVFRFEGISNNFYSTSVLLVI